MKSTWNSFRLCMLCLVFLGYSKAAQAVINVTPANDLAVFEPQNELGFQISGGQSYRLLDFEQQEVATGSLPADGRLQLPNPGPGYYQLTIEGENESTLFSFGVIPEFHREAIDWSKNQFGAMVSPHFAYPLEERELDARYMERIGMRFVRTHRLSWIQMQPQPDAPVDWETADREVEIYEKHGLDIISNTGWPLQDWASSGEGTAFTAGACYPKEEYVEPLRRFMTDLAARYRGKIAYWEIGNEVDANLFWLGRVENIERGDFNGIIADFADYYTIVAQAIHSGDPEAQVGPNTTGAAPDGVTYRNWLSEFLKHDPAVAQMDFFSTHYKVDLEKVRNVLAERDKQEIDIILTELGGICEPLKTRGRPTWEEICYPIPLTYNHMITELFHNGRGLCKFLLREVPIADNWVCGLLSLDFKVRPEYVTYATLIRMLAGAEPQEELNLTQMTTDGWGLGYAFRRNDEIVNAIMLMDADSADLTVRSDLPTLKVTDALGREHTVEVKDGEAVVKITRLLPLFITGKISGMPGPVRYPQPEVIREFIPELDGSFEAIAPGKNVPTGFRVANQSGELPESFIAEVTDREAAEGKHSFMLKGEEQTQWYSLNYDFPAEEIPKLQRGEYLELSVRFRQKLDNVVGIGTGVTLAAYDAAGTRYYRDCGFKWGTTEGWEEASGEVTFEIPSDIVRVSVEFYLGLSTGTVYLDDIRPILRVFRKSGAATERIN